MRIILAAALTLASSGVSASTVYYVDLVNTAKSSIVSLEVARSGSERFHVLHLGAAPLQEGAAATVAIRKGNDRCLRDLRVVFADGRVVTHRGFDVCAQRSAGAEGDQRG
jgi:hypothetical protein